MESTTIPKPIFSDQGVPDESGRRFVPVKHFRVACVVAAVSVLVAVGSLIAQVTAHVSDDPLRALEQRLEKGEQLAAGDVRIMADGGSAEAQFRLAETYRAGDGVEADIVEAYTLYLAAAEAGHSEAQHEVAEMYAYGYGVKQDFAKASEWAARATKNGYGKPVEETAQD